VLFGIGTPGLPDADDDAGPAVQRCGDVLNHGLSATNVKLIDRR
jgi:hypothetical protein